MKYKLAYRRKKGITSFYIEGDKGDELIYADAEALRGGSIASMVPLAYATRGKVLRFTYAAQGFVPLVEVLKSPLISGQFSRMLRSFLDVLKDCEGSSLTRQHIQTDPEYILYDPMRQRLLFVYVPLRSFVSAASGMKGALTYVCEHAMVPAEEMALRSRALDIARRMVVLTSSGYSQNLEMLGMTFGRGATPRNDDGSWEDSDQLGDRVDHGFDFVARQRAEAVAEERRAAAERLRQAEDACRSAIAAASWVLTRIETGTSWALAPGVYEIGRDAGESISLPDVVGLSRRHACLHVMDDGRCWVSDLNSTNGVKVNGVRIVANVPVGIERGSQLTLGRELFQLD